MANLQWGGWKNGRIPYDQMVDITGQSDWAHPAAAASWKRMVADCARETGVRLGINEAYRTYETQAWYAGPNSPLPSNVARAVPGTSNHGWGRALDITGYDAAWGWLQDHAADYGWDWTTGRYSDERWHWEYIGSLSDFAGMDYRIIGNEIVKDWFDMATDADLDRVVKQHTDRLEKKVDTLLNATVIESGIADDVNRIYQGVLGRVADPEGLATYSNALKNGSTEQEVINSLAQSDEFLLRQVQFFAYNTVLQRDGGPSELRGWVDYMRTGKNIEDVKAAMRGSQEYRDRGLSS